MDMDSGITDTGDSERLGGEELEIIYWVQCTLFRRQVLKTQIYDYAIYPCNKLHLNSQICKNVKMFKTQNKMTALPQ